jgi:predicted nucleic acid-binding protein
LSASAPTYVVDASVAIKWFVEDEDRIEQSRTVLTAFGSGLVRLLAPEHLILEVANAIQSAVQSRRLTAQDGEEALSYLLSLNIPLVSGRELIVAGYRIASRYECVFYDALYLALADAVRCPLLHADRKLQASVAGRFPLAHWIDRFSI